MPPVPPTSAGGGASASSLYAGASAAMDLMSGLFGYFASEETAAIAESRGRMVRMEAEAEAQRYQEQAEHFRASQKLAFLKSGVTLSGSPLDVLDESARVEQENLSAIRARGAAGELDWNNQAGEARMTGRAALLSGITSGLGKAAWASYQSDKSTGLGQQDRKNLPTGLKY